MSSSVPSSLLSPHASVLRPEVHSSRAIVPGSPMPHMYDNGGSGENTALTSPTAAATNAATSLAGITAGLSGLSTLRNYSSSNLNLAPSVPKKFKIYYCLEMSQLAQQIVRLDDRFVLADIQWEHFPDGFPNLFITGAEQIKNYHVCFLANFHSPAVFFEQFSVITALPKLLPKSFKLFLPFFPTGTMERVSRLGEVATANSLARVLSTIPNCSKGPAQICIFDIHALQVRKEEKEEVGRKRGSNQQTYS